MSTISELVSTKIEMYYRRRKRKVGFCQVYYLHHVWENRSFWDETGEYARIKTEIHEELVEAYPIRGTGKGDWHQVTNHLIRRGLFEVTGTDDLGNKTEGYGLLIPADDLWKILEDNQGALLEAARIAEEIGKLWAEREACQNA